MLNSSAHDILINTFRNYNAPATCQRAKQMCALADIVPRFTQYSGVKENVR